MVIKKGSFKIDVYNYKVYIYICDNDDSLIETANKIIDKYKEPRIAHPCTASVFTPDLDLNICYLFLHQNDLGVNTITHETDHIRNYIIDLHSLTENTDSKEASANLNGYINERVFRFLVKNNFEIKY